MARDIFQSPLAGPFVEPEVFPRRLAGGAVVLHHDGEGKRAAIEGGVAANGDLFTDVGDPPIEPRLLVGEDMADERRALLFSYLDRLVRHHQHHVVGHRVDERTGVEGILTGLQARPGGVEPLDLFACRRPRVVAHPYQVARRIDNRELTHAPGLMLRSGEPRNAAQWQLQRRELRVELVGIEDAPVAGRVVRLRGQLALEKEVHHEVPAGHDLVGPRRLAFPPGLESQPLVELARLFEISRRQDGFRSFRSHGRCPRVSADSIAERGRYVRSR